MLQPFLGMIMIYGFNWAPKGWAICSGQILSIAQNQALFALLGTMYGGNGTTTFALPDLRGKVPLGMGQGGGLSSYTQGQVGGGLTKTLLISEMPAHTHTINATNEKGNAGSPENAYLANSGARDNEYIAPIQTTSKKIMNTTMVDNAGSSSPISLMQPYLTVNYCMALVGIFPSRN